MKKRLGAIAAATAVVLATLFSIIVMAPSASAATANPGSPSLHIHSIGSPAATPPSTSPGITRIDVGNTASYTQCSSGYLCAYVPTAPDGWYEFKFLHCQRYYLSNWFDDGANDSLVIDDQTGGVTTTYYGASGNVLQTMKPNQDAIQWVLFNKGGWNPVYSIQVC